MTYCMVLVTCDEEFSAHDLAGKLLKNKLAACIQIHPVTSIYTWEKKVHKDREFRMVIKTRTSLYPELEAFIVAHHSYEVPQIIQVPVNRGLESYLNWINNNTS